jgi:hypothetical protein
MNLVSLFLGSTKLPIYSDNGNSHNFNDFNYKLVTRTSGTDLPDPIDETKPIIFWIHPNTSFSLLFEKYPKAKVLLIQYSLDDFELIELNKFYKVLIDSWGAWPGIKQNWESIKHHFNNELKPSDIPEDKIMQGIKSLVKNQRIPHPYKEGIKIDDNRIFICKFKDILNDKQKILKKISEFTEKPIPEIIENNNLYDNYLIKQKKIWKTLNYDNTSTDISG